MYRFFFSFILMLLLGSSFNAYAFLVSPLFTQTAEVQHDSLLTARQAFFSMPDSILPYLTKNNKLDMPDFLDSKMAAKVKNRFGEITEMTVLTADYLFLKTGNSSSFQLKVLPLPSGQEIIALINTVSVDSVSDSRISFYSSNWEKLLPTSSYGSVYDMPIHFADSVHLDLKNQLSYALRIPFVSLKFSPNTTDLIASDERMAYLDDETKKWVKKYFTPSTICYSWENGHFIQKEIDK